MQQVAQPQYIQQPAYAAPIVPKQGMSKAMKWSLIILGSSAVLGTGIYFMRKLIKNGI